MAKADAHDEWRKLPYDERNKKDENGNFVNPEPECSEIEGKLMDDLRKIAKFMDKIVIYPTDSNVFE